MYLTAAISSGTCNELKLPIVPREAGCPILTSCFSTLGWDSTAVDAVIFGGNPGDQNPMD